MRVAQTWRYPVKSMQGEQLPAVEVDTRTVSGDRAWGVLDSQTGTVLTARTARPLLHARATLDGDAVVIALPDGRRLRADDEHTDLALSAYLDRPVHLEQAKPDETGVMEAPIDFADDESEAMRWQSLPGTFNDGHPLHLLTTASLRGGAGLHPDGAWDVRRFRPNVLVDLEGNDFPEDEWTSVRIGPVEVEVYKRCTRCAMTARAQPGLDDDLSVPRTIARNRNAKLGVYARVITPGTISVGDEVELPT